MKKEIILCVYKITSPSGKIYIGNTTNKEERFKKYKYLRCKSQRILFFSLKKYGFENHKFEIIHILEQKNLTKSEIIYELNRLEIYYIKKHNSFIDDNPNFGMNLTRGGGIGEMSKQSIEISRAKNTGKKHTDKFKKHKSESMKGEKNHFFGKKHTEEAKEKQRVKKLGKKANDKTRKKLSEARIGENNNFYNKKHTKETRDTMSKKAKDRFKKPENNPFFGRKHKKESIEKIKATKKNKTQSEKDKIKINRGKAQRLRFERERQEMEMIRQERAVMIF